MRYLDELNSKISSEAEAILNEYGLLELLSKHGNPIVTGSYTLNLMVWRDLDIYLENDKMDEKRFFLLGVDLASILKPSKMIYRNEYIGKTTILPEGLYWGIYTNLDFSDTWKIDVWSIPKKKITYYLKNFGDLKKNLTKEKRDIILEIKHKSYRDPEYHRGFFSIDIYNAVLKDNIKSIQEFTDWLKDKKGLNFIPDSGP